MRCTNHGVLSAAATIAVVAVAGAAQAAAAGPRTIGRPSASAGATAGTLYAWGANYRGQLGDGTITSRDTPVTVRLPVGTTVTAVAGGSKHSLAVTSTGGVLAWGNNFRGQLGD